MESIFRIALNEQVIIKSSLNGLDGFQSDGLIGWRWSQ